MTAEARTRSDAFAARLTEALGDDPAQGVPVDWSAGADERGIAAVRAAVAELRTARASELDPAVAVDLDLLLRAGEREIRSRERARAGVPLLDPVGAIGDDIAHALAATDAANAVFRLDWYVGAAAGNEPLAVQAVDRTREALARTPAAVLPSKDVLERQLSSTQLVLDELETSLAGVAEAGPLLEMLRRQVAAYDSFLVAELLPRAPERAPLDPEAYRRALEASGIDDDPDALAARAHAAFAAIVSEMAPLAAEIAAAHGWPDPDYRAVLRELKRDRLAGDALEAMYRERIVELDAIVTEHALVTLPTRPLAFRMATAAESARMPAPMYLPPPPELADQPGTFVLPVSDPAAGGAAYDDFDFRAASWWLAAHEGRPGHDLQWSTMAEHPPSVARRTYAFNSTNAEGWGLYAESLVLPYAPPEGRLLLLDARLMRAAHAFLDIELNLGRIGPDEVRRVMVEEVGFSPAWADTCVLRYTSLMPGQAPSYFYGYERLVALRDEARARFGDRFDPRAFHDAVLAQGLLPPDLLRDAILTGP